MCGIGGMLRTDGKPIPEEWLDAIDARIAWRGPDGSGRFRDRVETVDEKGQKRAVEVAFVHRRLSIIDHEGGKQPMVSERGRNEKEGLVAVVFNGCIYNHRELRKELEAKGHQFVTDHSDTEVLIHGWREWGVRLVDRLEGMYAFALWDRSKASTMLARDRFGEKPLYVHDSQNVLRFGSEASLGGTSRSLSISDARMYLQLGYLRCSMAGRFRASLAGQVEQGFAILCHRDQDRQIANPEPLGRIEESFSNSQIEQLLDRSVARRLEADVPLGCFLSGGVDSSLVAHFAKRHKSDLRTFSIRMPDPRFDESLHAERVACHLGIEHTTLDAQPNPAEDLVRLVGLLGQPFGDSSLLPTYWVSQAARQHVKAALSGDGGDELFVGYERYLAARLLARRWKQLRHLPASFFHRFLSPTTSPTSRRSNARA